MNDCVQLVSFKYFLAINDLSISDVTPAGHVKRHTNNACSGAHFVDHSHSCAKKKSGFAVVISGNRCPMAF